MVITGPRGRENVLNVPDYERIGITDTGEYLLCIGGVCKLRNFKIFEGARLFLEIQHFFRGSFNTLFIVYLPSLV